MAYIRREHKNDIYIADKEWIRWIDCADKADERLEIEQELKAMQPFWNNLMTKCDSECCGIQAYDFTTENIKEAINEIDKMKLVKQLVSLKEITQATTKAVVSSRILNHFILKSVFLQLLDHLIDTLSEN
ncbi:MAG: DUF6331 family protein [Flavipsychrobacter sp.]